MDVKILGTDEVGKVVSKETVECDLGMLYTIYKVAVGKNGTSQTYDMLGYEILPIGD